jgi:preprotein translocase subunit SecB
VLGDAPKRRVERLGVEAMAEENGNGGGDAAAPRFSVVAQYVKDFSFENPNAPRSFGQQPAGLNLQVNVNGRQIAATDYEIELLLEGGAGEGPGVAFKFELHYAGVFRIENVPAEQVQPLAMIEGPRLLFPFARQIIADAVRNGGYPPLYVDPIDFHRLYLQRLQAANAAPANA